MLRIAHPSSIAIPSAYHYIFGKDDSLFPQINTF